MEKTFTSLRSFTDHTSKMKFCVRCGKIATQEALFNVGEGITLIEKYCDICAKEVK
jgi:hypothetical protein